MISLRLITIKTRVVVAEIVNNGTYDFSSNDKTIEVMPVSGAVKYDIKLDGAPHVEGSAPYHALGDDIPWKPAPGPHTIVVNALDAKGKTVETRTVQITATGAEAERIGKNYTVTDNLDDIPALKNNEGITLPSDGGTLTATRTLNPRLNGFVGTPKLTDKPAHVKVPSPAGRAIDFVSSSGENAVVQNVVVETTGPDARTAAAVRLSGKNQRVLNVRQIGIAFVLRFTGAVGAVCKNIYANSATCREYAMGSFGEHKEKQQDGKEISVPTWNVDCKIPSFDIAVRGPSKPITGKDDDDGGVHSARYEHTKNCEWGTMDKTVRLPELKDLPGPKGNGFAARAKQGKFTAMAVNDGEGAKLMRIKFEGRTVDRKDPKTGAVTKAYEESILALGPIELWAGPHPEWRMKNPLVKECEGDVLVCNRGTVGIRVEGSRFKRFEINHGIAGTFSDCDGTITDTTFTDPAKKPPVNAKLTYLNSTWCGKKLGAHGEV